MTSRYDQRRIRPPIEDLTRDFDDERERVWTVGRWISSGLATLAALGILGTTCYKVDTGDRAVVQKFGAYSRTEGPGFHGKLPWPIESQRSVPLDKIRRVELGYRTIGIDEQGKPKYENHPEEVLMMTEDENLAIVEFSLQYFTKDVFGYAFNVNDPEGTLHDIAQAAMRRIIAQEPIDSVLLTGKPEIQIRAKEDIQRISDLYGVGVTIYTVQLGDVRPPPQVKDAFDDVQRASEDKETRINEALKYENQVVPKAEGDTFGLLQEAAAYKINAINHARGDADRFTEILKRVESDPDIAKRQLYLTEMREIVSKYRKIVVDSDVPVNIFMGENR